MRGRNQGPLNGATNGVVERLIGAPRLVTSRATAERSPLTAARLQKGTRSAGRFETESPLQPRHRHIELVVEVRLARKVTLRYTAVKSRKTLAVRAAQAIADSLVPGPG